MSVRIDSRKLHRRDDKALLPVTGDPVPNDTDVYVFRVHYRIIRKGDGGKKIERAQTGRAASFYPDGKDLYRWVAEKVAPVEFDKMEFIEQYDPMTVKFAEE